MNTLTLPHCTDAGDDAIAIPIWTRNCALRCWASCGARPVKFPGPLRRISRFDLQTPSSPGVRIGDEATTPSAISTASFALPSRAHRADDASMAAVA